VEEAEEAEPDEEFKDAIEVGGPSPHPLLTRQQLGGAGVVGFFIFLYPCWKSELALS
jgi:hypothetical protein